MAKHTFQTEVNQLLDLMIHSLYSNKEIFLRELVSNASDALEKLQYLTLTDENLKNISFKPRIDISFDEERKILSISDNGIGMNENELIEHLGTIAKSGTKGFVSQLSGDKKRDSQLIGQFGVGFYSAFMVADRVIVTSRKAGEDKGYAWISEGKGDYELSECTKDSHGTEIKLFLNDEDKGYASRWKIEDIVKKYSDHIPFPIFIHYTKREGDGDATTEVQKEEQLNRASALWRTSKSELKDEDYREFYKSLSHDSSDPLAWVHTKVEGNLEYTTLFYIPSKAQFDLYRVNYDSGVKLYVKRVFITDNDKELLPSYLRFVRGIIDSEDLPLNVSREILQQNKILANIKSASTKKILQEIETLSKDEEKYKVFFAEFGRALKEGLYGDFENRDKLLELMRFHSTKSDEKCSFSAYKERMIDGQKAIYYLMGEDSALIKNSPLLEKFEARGIEVMLFDDEVDALVMPMIEKYGELPLRAINSAEADKDFEDSTVDADDEATFSALISVFKESLGDMVKDVRLSKRLVSSPACIVTDDDEPNAAMMRMLKQMGGGVNMPEPKPTLELNPNHTLLKKLRESNDEAVLKDYAYILLEQSKLLEGGALKDSAHFTKLLNSILERAI
ncbi:MAG: molecular chaperone HtpG [Wolinella sp.]